MPDENTIRLFIFIGILAAMALIELRAPKRVLTASKPKRWLTNLAIGGLDSLLIRLMAMVAVPLSALAAAHYASAQNFGLFHWFGLSPWIEIPLSIILLDFAIYLQHVASHKIPILWRLHKVHHSDKDIDVTTAIRFHPIEIGLSMLYKILWVLAFGCSLWAVFLFEIILNGCAMFNHANIALPKKLDQILRSFIVTPDMHRVHHSDIPSETDSNYGFNLSIWDRLFGTYIHEPKKGHENMTIGLKDYKDQSPTELLWSLKLPFKK